MGLKLGGDFVKLIVECDISERTEAIISEICRVKYCLPDLGFYVVEIEKDDFPKAERLSVIGAVHATARIETQNRAQNKTHDGPQGEVLANTLVRRGWAGWPPVMNRLVPKDGEKAAIAFLDTGVSPVADLTEPENRIIAFKDFIGGEEKPYDDNAHGTHVTSVAAGNGTASEGRHLGVAPDCRVVSVKILDHNGEGDAAEFMAGIQWILSNKDKYNVRVANMSVGASDLAGSAPLIKAVEIAWDKGIVVCAAAGNNGPGPGTVTLPGQSRKIITVGSSDDHRLTQIRGISLINFSGRGPTRDCIVKPDIIAPGANIVGCMALESRLTGRRIKEISAHKSSDGYIMMSGTSMSTPIVSGAVALLLEKNPRLQPNDVKYLLKKTAIDLGYPSNQQGWGALNLDGLLNSEH